MKETKKIVVTVDFDNGKTCISLKSELDTVNTIGALARVIELLAEELNSPVSYSEYLS